VQSISVQQQESFVAISDEGNWRGSVMPHIPEEVTLALSQVDRERASDRSARALVAASSSHLAERESRKIYTGELRHLGETHGA